MSIYLTLAILAALHVAVVTKITLWLTRNEVADVPGTALQIDPRAVPAV